MATGIRDKAKGLKAALYGAAAALLVAAVVARSLAPDGGVSIIRFVAVGAVAGLVCVLPGYVLLRACGLRWNSWVDWLAPSFGASLVLDGLWAIPGYLLGWPLWSGLAVALATVVAVGAFALRRSVRGLELRCASFRDDAASAGWAIGLNVLTLLVMAQTAFLSLRAIDYGADLWFHCASVTCMAQEGRLLTSDPFHGTAQPHPMYLMNVWHAVLAVLSWSAGLLSVDTVRIVPVFMAPVAISAQAFLLRRLLLEHRARILALAAFVLYLSCLATSMEASPERSMWREFALPRWVALFAIYPLVLGLAAQWMTDGRWRALAAVAALNAAAVFVHPQGGEYLFWVMPFMLLGGLLLRDWRWSARAGLVLGGAALCAAALVTVRYGLVSGSADLAALVKTGTKGLGRWAAVADAFRGEVFGRAAKLLCSPLFWAGLAGVGLWWRQAAGDGRKRFLLLALCPALCLPGLPLAELLPVRPSPNLVYRMVWAAPVLAATGLAFHCVLRWVKETRAAPARRFDAWGVLWLGLFAAILVLAHIWPPRRFEPWWKDEALKGVLLTAVALLAVHLSRAEIRRWAWWAALAPGLLVLGWSVVGSLRVRGQFYDVDDFVAKKNSAVLQVLREKPSRRGVVLTDPFLGAQLTAWTGRPVLGADKGAIDKFGGNRKRVRRETTGLLSCSQDLGPFIDTLIERQVQTICVFPDRNATLVERLNDHPLLFPIRVEDHGIRCYDVRISPEDRLAEARRMVDKARTLRAAAAGALLAEAQALGGRDAIPADLIMEAEAGVRQSSEEAIQALLVGSPGERVRAFFAACSLSANQPELEAAKKAASVRLLAEGRLARKTVNLQELAAELQPVPVSLSVGHRGGRRLAWRRTSEVTCQFAPPTPAVVEAVGVTVPEEDRPTRVWLTVRPVEGRPVAVRLAPEAGGGAPDSRFCSYSSVGTPLLDAAIVRLHVLSFRPRIQLSRVEATVLIEKK